MKEDKKLLDNPHRVRKPDAPSIRGWGTKTKTDMPEEFRTKKRRKSEGWKEEVTEERIITDERLVRGEWKEFKDHYKVVTLTKEFTLERHPPARKSPSDYLRWQGNVSNRLGA